MQTLNFSELEWNIEKKFQGILVISCVEQLPSSQLLQQIFDNASAKSEFKPMRKGETRLLKFDVESYENTNSLECHAAQFDNKYYSAQIYFVTLDDLLQRFPQQFYELFHGVIIYFDNTDNDGLKIVDRWINYIDTFCNCSIKLLACETATDDHAISRVDCQKYCIKNNFELIELKPQVETRDEDDLEDDFIESNSYDRIYQAIQAHVWPVMECKSKADGAARNLRVRFDDATTSKSDDDDDDKDVHEDFDEKDAETFEDIFSRFMKIKEEAAKLDERERRQYAEKIAIKFWNSIGNDDDDDHFTDFSSDEEAEPCDAYV